MGSNPVGRTTQATKEPPISGGFFFVKPARSSLQIVDPVEDTPLRCDQ